MDENTFFERLKRYSGGSLALTVLSKKYLSAKKTGNHEAFSQDIVKRLGNFRGPLMKIGQFLAMVPDILPEPYVKALSSLQAQAPPMGGLFVKRRLRGELGPHWYRFFKDFNLEPFAAASIGQVHKAQDLKGKVLACKLQYPNMGGIIEADLSQLQLLLTLYEKIGGNLKTQKFFKEIQTYLYEEIDYKNEARNIKIFQNIFNNDSNVSIPKVVPNLSTDRLLTMSYMEGESLESFSKKPLSLRNQAAKNLFFAWYHPLYSFGYLHGDPHAGNYLFSSKGNITLLDFGCVRKFSPEFIQGTRLLYEALKTNKEDMLVHAYELWGFKNLTKDLIETLTLWATFLYDPLLDNRTRPISETYNGKVGKEVAKKVLKDLKAHGKIELPREFILMDRASVGMGAAFIKLKAELNWHQLFEHILKNNPVA
jgi:predicted unusual protein kinase regulating ubiquinone biosynthesis (AarF/ABC1/UbiB family)